MRTAALTTIALCAITVLADRAEAQCNSNPPAGITEPLPPPNAGSPVVGYGRSTGNGTRATGPASPSRPGPSTPGGGGPRGGLTRTGSGGPTTPRGAPMVFERSQRSLDALQIDWDLPVPDDGAQAMDYRTALRAVRGDDPRPVLLIREAHSVEGPGAGMLTSHLEDEQVRTMTRWFHCINLPDVVRDPANPFHGLFDQDWPPLLFLADHDGEHAVGFNGFEPRSALRDAMLTCLERAYHGKPRKSVRRILAVLEQYDRFDAQQRLAREAVDEAIETHGEDSRQHRKAERTLRVIGVELDGLAKREEHESRLVLRSRD